MANKVTLTFAGETKPAEDAFKRVGDSSEKMGEKVGHSGAGFDRAGEAADGAEGKAQGFSDTLTGVADIGAGTGEIMKGNLFEGFVTVGTGVADLAGGMATFLIPALKASRLGTLASAAAQKVAAAASKVWAGAQWLMNTALLASPLTWIVLAIAAVIVIIVVIAKRTDWFSKLWTVAWKWIKDAASNAWDFIKRIPGWIGSAFAKIARFITDPFRAAFNMIARLWNNTIGQLSWTVPDWVPIIGGNSISVPHLPQFHAGGVVPGVAGTNVVAMLQAGETVGSVASTGGGGFLPIGSDGTRLGDALITIIAEAVSRKGGRPGQLGLKAA